MRIKLFSEYRPTIINYLQIVFQISIHHFGSAIFDFEILISNLDSASSKSQNGKSVSFTSRYNFLFPRINFSLRIIFSLEIGQKV